MLYCAQILTVALNTHSLHSGSLTQCIITDNINQVRTTVIKSQVRGWGGRGGGGGSGVLLPAT